MERVPQLSIDAQLVPIVEKLEELYPPGQCLRHPDVRCVAASNGWHFDIDTTRIKVWALAVVSTQLLSFELKYLGLLGSKGDRCPPHALRIQPISREPANWGYSRQ